MSVLKERLIAGATIVGTVLGCLGLGYQVGKDTNESLVGFLREKTQEAEKTANQLRFEVSALKLELQSSGTLLASSDVVAKGEGATAVAGAATGKATGEGTLSVATGAERVVLQRGQTASLFEDKIIISLIGISFEGDPLRNRAFATVGSPGKKNASLESADVGHAVVFEGYEVRLVACDTFNAAFLVAPVSGGT